MGDRSPAFSFVSIEGDTLIKDSLKGDIIIIDFWASWNQPSRKHNLDMVKLYEKYRQINFIRKNQIVFISYSLDTQHDLWMIAKSKDNLHWRTNVSDLKGWESPIAETFMLKKIPSNFILDREGSIIAKDIWGKELDSLLTVINR